MSRSRKKKAITGFTCAKSEKYDKRIINRSIRRITRRILEHDAEDSIFPIQDDIMSVWSMQKDGKMWHREEKKPECGNCRDKIRCLTDETYKAYCVPYRRHQWYLKALRK